MIKRVFLGNHNEVLNMIVGGGIEVQCNTPCNANFYDLPVTTQVNIGDYFENGQLIALQEKPSAFLEFDYTQKKWIDPRSLQQIQDEKWNNLRYQRDALEFGGFLFDGGIYDSDQVSQGRILGAANAGVDQVWTLADNSIRPLKAEQLKQLYQALQIHIADAHERGRIARQRVYNTTTVEAINEVLL